MRKLSLFALPLGGHRPKLCLTSCITLQWGHRSVYDFFQLLSLEQLESVLNFVKMDLTIGVHSSNVFGPCAVYVCLLYIIK